MKATVSELVRAGVQFELAETPAQAMAASSAIRRLLEAEDHRYREEARHIIEMGREEARRVAISPAS